MTQQALDLPQKVLSLSEEERAELASSLLDSLDATVDKGAENAWGEEIARRIADIDSEKAKDGSMGRGSKKDFVQTHP